MRTQPSPYQSTWALQWLPILQTDRKRFEQAWEKAHSLLLNTKKWANVKGPISGCVMTLLQLGWECEQPHAWTAPIGACFELMEGLEANKHSCAELIKDISASVDRALWDHSATPGNGLGRVHPLTSRTAPSKSRSSRNRASTRRPA